MKLVGKRKWFGQTNHNECEIKLSSRCKDDEELLHTFLHELTHAIAYAMGWNEFNDDEGKIDGFASLLMQTMVTAK